MDDIISYSPDGSVLEPDQITVIRFKGMNPESIFCATWILKYPDGTVRISEARVRHMTLTPEKVSRWVAEMRGAGYKRWGLYEVFKRESEALCWLLKDDSL